MRTHYALGLDPPSSQPYTRVVALEKYLRHLANDWSLWEYGGAALIAVGRSLFSRSSSEPPPSAATDPGITLTPRGWEKDNGRLSAAKNPQSAIHSTERRNKFSG
jgi:hypothetical protein